MDCGDTQARREPVGEQAGYPAALDQSAIHAYDEFAPFYNGLLDTLRRDEDQSQLILWLLRRYHIAPSAPVADVACGCGGVLARLVSAGLVNAVGFDASAGMVHFARQRCEQSRVRQGAWPDLPSQAPKPRHFSAVWALALASAHISDAELSRALMGLESVLAPNGVCILDVRPWVNVHGEGLRESGRPAGVFRWLAQITVKGRDYEIEDVCAYDKEVQNVTYVVRSVTDAGGVPRRFRFSIALRDWKALALSMRASGFQDVEALSHPAWPYLLVAARSKR